MASNKEKNIINDKEGNNVFIMNNLTEKQKEMLLTIVVIFLAVIIGTVIGYFLSEAMRK